MSGLKAWRDKQESLDQFSHARVFISHQLSAYYGLWCNENQRYINLSWLHHWPEQKGTPLFIKLKNCNQKLPVEHGHSQIHKNLWTTFQELERELLLDKKQNQCLRSNPKVGLAIKSRPFPKGDFFFGSHFLQRFGSIVLTMVCAIYHQACTRWFYLGPGWISEIYE